MAAPATSNPSHPSHLFSLPDMSDQTPAAPPAELYPDADVCVTESPEMSLPDGESTTVPPADESAGPDVRSQLAGLFRRRATASDIPAAPASPGPAAEDVPLSTAAAESESRALEHGPSDDHAESITRYLAELLNRDRSSKGSEASSGTKPSTERAGGSGRREFRPVKSFLESCTIGQTEHESTSEAAAAVAAGGHRATEPKLDPDGEAGARQSARPSPRPQVNPDVQRQMMNSYRKVSVQAVEKALAAHTLRKARAGLYVRRIVLLALLLTSTFVVVAHLTGTVQSTSLIWLMGLASAASAGEMVPRIRKIRRLRSQAEELPDEEHSPSRRSLRPGPGPDAGPDATADL